MKGSEGLAAARSTPRIDAEPPVGKSEAEALRAKLAQDVASLEDIRKAKESRLAAERGLAEKAGIGDSYEAARTVEDELFAARKEYYKSNNMLQRRGIGASGESMWKLEGIKQLEAKARLAHLAESNAAIKSAEARFEAWAKKKQGKNKAGEDIDYLSPTFKEDFMNRYRRITRNTELGIRPEQQKIEARREALDEKGKNAFDKALEWTGAATKNKWNALEKKHGKGTMKAVRLGVTAAGATALLGGVAGLGIGASIALRLGRAVVGGYLGAKAGKAVGKKYEKGLGAKAIQELKSAAGTDKEFDADALKVFEQLYKKGSTKTIARNKMIVEFGTAILTGAGTAQAANLGVEGFMALDSVQTASAEVPASGGGIFRELFGIQSANAGVPAHPEGFVHGDIHPGHLNTLANSEYSADDMPTRDVSPTFHIDNADKLHVEISEAKGGAHNADRMFQQFQHELVKQGHYSLTDPKTPESIKELLRTNPHALSTKFEFAAGNQSQYMHAGDQIKLSENGDLVFTPKGGHEVILAHSGEHGFEKATSIEHHYQTHHPAEYHPKHPHHGHGRHHETAGEKEADRLMEKGNPTVFHHASSTLENHVAPVQSNHIPTPTPRPDHFVSEKPPVSSNAAETSAQPLSDRLESATAGSARGVLDTEVGRNGLSASLLDEAIKAAPHMQSDPSLVSYIEPNTGAIPGPAVFLGHDGRLTVFGAADGDTYKAQLAVAHRFAEKSGHAVNVLLPDGEKGYVVVSPGGKVHAETPGLFSRYEPIRPVSESVYVFKREQYLS